MYTNANNMRLQEFFRGSNINIIKKMNRIMETDGYVCIFYKTKAELEETLTAYRYPPRLFIEEINTSAEECKQFVKEGLCGDRTKICEDEDECHTQAPDFKEQYEWYNTKVVEYKDCSFTRIRLHTDIYDHNTIINNCKTNDLTCEIDKKRYIWDKIEIPTCPFETIIYNETFSFDKDNGNIIFSERLGIAFEMKNSFKICNTSTVWETTSGLIAEKTSEQRLRKENITVDSYSRMKILEAESDFKSYKNAYINSHERKVDCIQMINTIRTIKNTIDNRVFKITNHKGVFYSYSTYDTAKFTYPAVLIRI
jgi:hypothetical protein